jgi:hypothetical protein
MWFCCSLSIIAGITFFVSAVGIFSFSFHRTCFFAYFQSIFLHHCFHVKCLLGIVKFGTWWRRFNFATYISFWKCKNSFKTKKAKYNQNEITGAIRKTQKRTNSIVCWTKSEEEELWGDNTHFGRKAPCIINSPFNFHLFYNAHFGDSFNLQPKKCNIKRHCTFTHITKYTIYNLL